MVRAALIVGLLGLPMATSTPAEFAPGCDADLAAVDRSFTETLARLQASRNATSETKCDAYRHHVDVMAAAREVFMRCLPEGRGRSENVGQMDDSIEDFRYVLENQGCN